MEELSEGLRTWYVESSLSEESDMAASSTGRVRDVCNGSSLSFLQCACKVRASGHSVMAPGRCATHKGGLASLSIE